MMANELHVTDVQFHQDQLEVTSFGDTERKYIPMGDTKVTMSGTLSNATAGWFGGTTTVNTTPTFIYTQGVPYPAISADVQWNEFEKPKTKGKSKSKNDPLGWLHDRVEEICELGYLDT
jgi:hypothetical protein